MSVILYRRKENGEIEAKAFDPFTFTDRIAEDWHMSPPEDEEKVPKTPDAEQPEALKTRRGRPKRVKNDNQG